MTLPQHTLKFIPYLQETDPDDTVLEPQTIIIPLLGSYGFQRFIQRFTVLFGTLSLSVFSAKYMTTL